MAFHSTMIHRHSLNKCYKDDFTISAIWLCDVCGHRDEYNKDRSDTRYRCYKCDYDICKKCYKKYKKYPTIYEESENEDKEESDEEYNEEESDEEQYDDEEESEDEEESDEEESEDEEEFDEEESEEEESEEEEEESDDKEYKCKNDKTKKVTKRESSRYIIHNKSGKIKFEKSKFRKILSNVLGIHKPTNIYSKDRKNYFSFRTNEIISTHIYLKFITNGLDFMATQ